MEGLSRYTYHDKRFSSKIKHAHEIIGTKDFYTSLNLERLRSDRVEQEFALILFEIRKSDNIKMLKQFISILHKRMRALDIAGWYDKEHLGIILPYCDMEGACKFTMDVENEMYKHFSSPPYNIFIYPDNWINTDKTLNKENNQPSECEDNTNVINIENMEPFSQISSNYEKKIHKLRKKILAVFAKKMPFWKRLTDILLSSVVLIIIGPPLLLVAAYIKIVSPGPVFFKQKRIGYKGLTFTMFKFRTMKVNNNDSVHKEYAKSFIKSDQKLVKLDSKDDKRIIPGGRFLRKACIDELPQLFNVLMGQMSIVGPRPPIPYEVDEYSSWHINRFDVVPGLTGLWQVSGKQKLTFNQMVRLDIQYKRKLSLLFDLYIMVKTIPTILGMIFEPVLKRIRKFTASSQMHQIQTMKKRSLYFLIIELFTRI